MPPVVRSVVDERDGLLTYLGQMRDALRLSAYGLDHEQAWSTPTVSALSIAGLVKHASRMERFWTVAVLARREPAVLRLMDSEFVREDGETLTGLLDAYQTVAAETEQIVQNIDDMGHPVPVPERPPFPRGQAWSARWVLLHVIQETARHAGHADIIRETIDGQKALPLMAEAEGWSLENLLAGT